MHPGPRQIRARQLGLPQISARQVSPSQYRTAKIHSAQVRPTQVRPGQIGALAAILPAKKSLVRLQNRNQLLPVVGDAFRLLQSHRKLPSICCSTQATNVTKVISNCFATEDFTENAVFTEPLRLPLKPLLRTTVVV